MGSRSRAGESNPIFNMSDTDDEELDKETLGKKIAEELPPEILQEYKDIFSFFDRDGGGSIGAEEFDQVMRTFGWEPKDEELKEMVSVIDQDGDGTISFNEFVWLMTRDFNDSDIEDEIKDAFRMFDKDGNGFISSLDLMDIMTSIGEILSLEEAEELIAEADVDGDGNINYEEFVGTVFKGPFGGSRLEKTKDDVESEKAIKKAKRYSKQTRYG